MSKTLADIPTEDREYTEYILDEVELGEEFITLHFDGHTVTGYEKAKAPDLIPKEGQTLRIYGPEWGSRRGLVIDDEVVEYRTAEEDKAHRQLQQLKANVERQREFEEARYDLDTRFEALPIPYRARISYFRSHNPEFRWEFESYELMVCEDAVKVRGALETPERIKELSNSGYEEQRELVPALNDGHSGNSFGMVLRLAYRDASGEMVELEHGALCALVGCEEYGCRYAEKSND